LSQDANTSFKLLMQRNPVVIFPELDLHAWDRLPRFTFLEADIKDKASQGKNRPKNKKEHVKSNFVGSPIRPPQEGGVLKITK
jgi:hypothetical protein